eukprot:symbB.v1.2.015831.t1/scaffold1194.1/size132594/4
MHHICAGGNGGGGGGMQFDPAALAAAAAKNPKIKEYMQDKDLMQKVNMLASLSGNMQQTMVMQMVQQDQRVLELFLAMQGVDVNTMRPEDFEQGPEPTPPPKKEAPKKEEPKEEDPPWLNFVDLRSPEQKEADEWKSKGLGNELYKKKQFKDALEMYDKAIQMVPNDITYHNNKNAVLIEMGAEHWDEVLKSCQDLLDRRYEINSANPGGASFEKVAKVFQRMASVYEKQHKYDDAIAMYNKALTEDNNRSVRNALRDCERAKEKHEKDAYLDPVKGEEHREKGNELSKGLMYIQFQPLLLGAAALSDRMASWHRPWESTRDRSTFALGFSSALVTDVFVELSRSFLLALRQGLVQNPPAYASEATIRPGDLYYLHKMMHATHDLAIKMMCALGTSPRLERFLFRVNFILLLLLVVVHLAFLCPSTQLQSSQNLSQFIAAEGGWNHCQAESNSTLVRLELLDTMWARPPPKPPTEIGPNLSEVVPPSFNWMTLIYDAVVPRPSYEIAVGEDASWLLVSSQMRENLGVHVKELQVSVQDQRFFGPYWARTLMSIFELYDIYVLHALPQFAAHCPQPALHVRLLSNPRVTVPLLFFQHRSAQLRSRWFRQRLREVVVTLGVLLVFLLAAILFSSFLRSLLVLSCRMYVNNQFCLRHLRRYAFIAQEMRRVNRAASTVLLELWVAWGASMLILLWTLGF